MSDLYKVQSSTRTKFKICDTVTASDGTKLTAIVGQTGQVDVISQNGYRYKMGFWDKVLNDPKVQEKVKSRSYLGTIEHPSDDDAYLSTPYGMASHVLSKVWVDHGNPWAQMLLLNNEGGCQIKALLEVGHHPGVSTRGLGEFEQDEISQYVSSEGYEFLGFDLVKEPNFENLHMEKVSDSLRASSLFKELVGQVQLRDSPDTSYNMERLRKDMDSIVSSLQRMSKYLESK